MILLQCDPQAFTEYLQQYQNTICGRHPIAVLLQVSFELIVSGTDYVLK